MPLILFLKNTFKMETKITFPKEPSLFFKELQKEVDVFFKENNYTKFGNNQIIFKYIIIKISMLCAYFLLFYFQNKLYVYSLFAFLGVMSIILAINVSHDAIHGVAHSNKFLNNFLKYQMDIIGANSFLWKQRHRDGHHNFPNTINKDPDIKQSNIVKILPLSKSLKLHQYQHIYVPFLYSLYTINWIYIRDFKDLFSKSGDNLNMPKNEIIKFLIFKLIYVSIFILLPIYFSPLTILQVFLSNLILHFSASYFLTIALLPSHVSENSTFIYPDKNGMMPYSWSYHQVITTTDFATNNALTTWLLGGFNHHISHHLFPSISHIHYPKITKIVKEKIQKYELEYKHENNILNAYLSHYKLLKKNGKSKPITF